MRSNITFTIHCKISRHARKQHKIVAMAYLSSVTLIIKLFFPPFLLPLQSGSTRSFFFEKKEEKKRKGEKKVGEKSNGGSPTRNEVKSLLFMYLLRASCCIPCDESAKKEASERNRHKTRQREEKERDVGPREFLTRSHFTSRSEMEQLVNISRSCDFLNKANKQRVWYRAITRTHLFIRIYVLYIYSLYKRSITKRSKSNRYIIYTYYGCIIKFVLIYFL